MKLLYSSTSPYSAKARMAAVYLGLAVEAVATKTDDNPAELIDNKPLGKPEVFYDLGGSGGRTADLRQPGDHAIF